MIVAAFRWNQTAAFARLVEPLCGWGLVIKKHTLMAWIVWRQAGVLFSVIGLMLFLLML